MANPDLRSFYDAKLANIIEREKEVEDIKFINAKLDEVDSILDKIEEHLKTNSLVHGISKLIT